MMLTTEDGYNIWASEIYTENPKAIIIYLSGIQQPSVTYYYGNAKWMQDRAKQTASIYLRNRLLPEEEAMMTASEIYDKLYTAYGQPRWWSDDPYIVMVQAVLV